MFRFLLGVAFGAAGYWAWQSFGRDLLGLGSDQDTYGGYSSTSSFGTTGSSPIGGSTSTSPSTPSSIPSTPSSTPSSSPDSPSGSSA